MATIKKLPSKLTRRHSEYDEQAFKKINEMIEEVNGITDGGSSFDTISEKTADTGVTVDGVLLKDSEVTTDVIKEKTAAAGVTIDGVKLKDSEVTTDVINEKTAAAGVTVDGVLLKDSQVTTDVINEKTATAGVTADGVLLKDSSITLADGLVSNLAVKLGADANNGIYGISDTQMGFAVEGALKGGADTNGLFTDVLSEQTSTVGVTIDGALIKDGAFTGKQATATATADGLTTGLLTGADQFVTVTSADANHIVALPLSTSAPIGTVIRGWVGANGFELRVDASEATTAKINNITTNVEAAIPATTFFTVTKVAALTWILTATDELGAVITAIVPDAV